VEPPAVLDRVAARQGLAVPLGQVAQLAVLRVALAELQVLQVPARLRVQRVPLLVQFQPWALQSLVPESWVLLVRPLSLRRW